MKMTQFPLCCGVVIISDLQAFPTPRKYSWRDYSRTLTAPPSIPFEEEVECFKKAIITKLRVAKLVQNRSYILAIWASDQRSFIPKELEKLGFVLQSSEINPRTRHTLKQYKLNLRNWSA